MSEFLTYPAIRERNAANAQTHASEDRAVLLEEVDRLRSKLAACEKRLWDEHLKHTATPRTPLAEVLRLVRVGNGLEAEQAARLMAGYLRMRYRALLAERTLSMFAEQLTGAYKATEAAQEHIAAMSVPELEGMLVHLEHVPRLEGRRKP